MDYKIVLDAFEGPLDLLLSLIEKSKIDIYDIPISVVTEQYLDYIYNFDRIDLDITSEFLVMAATLLQIKSKLLLPKEEANDTEFDEEDPRDELVKRLLAYKKYKEAAKELRNYEDIGLKIFYKPQEDLTQFEEKQFEIGPFDVESLFETLNKMLERRGLKTEELNFEEIRRDEYSVKECSENILTKLINSDTIKFSQLLNNNSTRNEIIAYFLSLLELMRFKNILVKQDNAFSDLIIIKNDIEAN